MSFVLLLQVSQLKGILSGKYLQCEYYFIGAFNGADSLSYLHLDYNNLITIQEGTFADLTNLFYIKISYNPIQTLEQGKVLKILGAHYTSAYTW